MTLEHLFSRHRMLMWPCAVMDSGKPTAAEVQLSERPRTDKSLGTGIAILQNRRTLVGGISPVRERLDLHNSAHTPQNVSFSAVLSDDVRFLRTVRSLSPVDKNTTRSVAHEISVVCRISKHSVTSALTTQDLRIRRVSSRAQYTPIDGVYCLSHNPKSRPGDHMWRRHCLARSLRRQKSLRRKIEFCTN